MAKIILTYKLKPNVTAQSFEDWVRTTDYPAMRGLARVASYTNNRVTGLLMGDGEPGMDYIEIFDVPDLNGFVSQDMPGDVIQGIMGAFMDQVEDAKFILAEEIV